MANDESNMQPPAGEAPYPPAAPAGEAVAPSPLVPTHVAPVEPPAPDAIVSSDATPPPPDRRSWETWADVLKVPLWKAEAARHGRAWPIGQEITESEFNQALYDAFNARIG